MSIVVCKVEKKEIVIGADMITQWGDTIRNDMGIKLFKEKNTIIGGVGKSEDIFLMRMFLKSHEAKEANEISIMDFYFEFMNWCGEKKKEPESNFTLLFKGKAFAIYDYAIYEIKNYIAMGAGRDFALPALYLGKDVKTAIEVAIKFSPLCSGPVKILKMARLGQQNEVIPPPFPPDKDIKNEEIK